MSDGSAGGGTDAPPTVVAASTPSDEELHAVSHDGVKVNVVCGRLESVYDVGKPIGKGKFSTVFKAIRRADGLPVALKQIAIFDVMDEKSREKCLKEIRLVQSLSHENIIGFLDGFIQDKQLILVFEYAEAGDLKRQLRKAREKEARFDERVIWKYFSQIVAAVAHMHGKRIMHRDLKPANIFLTINGTIKVGDLGLGRLLSENTLEAHSKVGTPLYMSPEVLQGKGYEWRSDIWSLGCILYELAMLRSPFKEEGLNLYGLFQKITQGGYPPVSPVYSEPLRNLVERMLQQNPSDRPEVDAVLKIANEMRDKTAKAKADLVAAASIAEARTNKSAAAQASLATTEVAPTAAPQSASSEPSSRLERPQSAHHSRRPGSGSQRPLSSKATTDAKDAFSQLRVKTESSVPTLPGTVGGTAHRSVDPDIISPAAVFARAGQPSPLDSPDAIVPYTAIMEVAALHRQQRQGTSSEMGIAAPRPAASHAPLHQTKSFFREDAKVEEHSSPSSTKPPRHLNAEIALKQAIPNVMAKMGEPGAPRPASASSTAPAGPTSISDLVDMCESFPAAANSTLVDMLHILSVQTRDSVQLMSPIVSVHRTFFVGEDDVASATSPFMKFVTMLHTLRFALSAMPTANDLEATLSGILAGVANGSLSVMSAAGDIVGLVYSATGKERLLEGVTPSQLAQGSSVAVLKVLTLAVHTALMLARCPLSGSWRLQEEAGTDDNLESVAEEEASDSEMTAPAVLGEESDPAVLFAPAWVAPVPEVSESAPDAMKWLQELERVQHKLTSAQKHRVVGDNDWQRRLEHADAAVGVVASGTHLMDTVTNRLLWIANDCQACTASISKAENRLFSMSGWDRADGLGVQFQELRNRFGELGRTATQKHEAISRASNTLDGLVTDIETTEEEIESKMADASSTDRVHIVRKALLALRRENLKMEMTLGVLRQAVLAHQSNERSQQLHFSAKNRRGAPEDDLDAVDS